MFGFGLFKFDHLYAKMLSFRHVCSFRVLRHVCFRHVSGMFLLSACFGMFDFGMFQFGDMFGHSHA